MLIKKAKISKSKESINYHSAQNTFCTRTGIKGFYCKNHFNKNLGIKSGKLFVNKRYISPIDPTDYPCIRLFLGSFTKFKIPQISLYAPDSGYPLCFPAKARFFKSSGNWPYKIKKYFVTVPIAHIMWGLLKGQGEPALHQYSVFFGDEDHDIAFVPQEFDIFNLDPKQNTLRTEYNNGYPFMGDKNLPDLSEIPGPWPYKNFSNIASDSDVDSGVVEAISNYSFGDPLTNEEFNFYLPYWFLYYTHKYHKFKGDLRGPPGSLGKNQGFIPYSLVRKSDILGSGSKALKILYNLSGEIKYIRDDFKVGYKDNILTFYDSEESLITIAAHLEAHGVPETTLATFFRIREAISDSIHKKYLPLVFSRASRRNQLYTHLRQDQLHMITQVLHTRKTLEDGSKLSSVADKTCPKCKGALVLPDILVQARPKTDNLVCMDCGYKYLANLVTHLSGKQWIYYKGYPLTDLFDTRIVSNTEEEPEEITEIAKS